MEAQEGRRRHARREPQSKGGDASARGATGLPSSYPRSPTTLRSTCGLSACSHTSYSSGTTHSTRMEMRANRRYWPTCGPAGLITTRLSGKGFRTRRRRWCSSCCVRVLVNGSTQVSRRSLLYSMPVPDTTSTLSFGLCYQYPLPIVHTTGIPCLPSPLPARHAYC